MFSDESDPLATPVLIGYIGYPKLIDKYSVMFDGVCWLREVDPSK